MARDRETVEPLPVDQPIECKPDHHRWVWLHLDLVDSRAKAWLENLAGLSEDACELLVTPDDHQQLHAFPGMLAGVFADHRLSFDDDSDEFGHLRFIATDRLLITARRHPLQAVEATKLDLQKKEECCASVPELVERIVDHIAAGAERRAEIVTRELESIEDHVLTDSVSDERRRLVALRRTMVRMHRHLAGLRSLFDRLSGAKHEIALSLPASMIAQRLEALSHQLAALEARARLFQEEIGAKLTEQTNRNLQILSVFTALFLPGTVITGMFGMNTKGLPFTDNEAGFWYAMALIVVCSAAAYYALRRMRVAN